MKWTDLIAVISHRQANEMLFCGRKLTAQEACSRGLVSQVFWPTTFNQEVMLRVKEMALCSAVVGRGLQMDEPSSVHLPHTPPPPLPQCVWKVLEESKCLVRSIVMSVLEEVNEKECQMLKQLWCSTKGLEALFSYLHKSCDKWSKREVSGLRSPSSPGWSSICVYSFLSSLCVCVSMWVCARACVKLLLFCSNVSRCLYFAIRSCIDEDEVQSQYAGNNQDVRSELIYLTLHTFNCE